MESITHQIGVSTITLAPEGLTIAIPRRHWRARHWTWLVQVLAQVLGAGLGWVLAPTVSSVAAAEADRAAPRWKPLGIDGLSYLLFVLLIPPGHPLRQLYAAFDWATIDAKCAAMYKNHARGAPAYAPQVLFRILVLMFISGTPFESRTLQRLQTDVAWRWFVGLSVLGPLPDAGTLCRFRQRVGVARFEAILVTLLEVCDPAGLIGHLEAYFDCTGVAASASQATPYERAVILAKALSAYLDEETGGPAAVSPEQIAAIVLAVLGEKHPSLKEVQPAQIVASQAHLAEEWARTVQGEPAWWQRLRQASAQVQHQLRGTPQAGLERLRAVARLLAPSLPQAFGNPDAAVGHTRTDGTLCGYRSGLLVDAKRRIIVAVIVVGLNCVEAPLVTQALDKQHAIFGRYPKRLGLDSAFDRAEVHAYLEAHAIAGGITVRSRPGAEGVFHADAFVWNDQGQLVCPNGAPMAQVKGPDAKGVALYRAGGVCAQCPLLNHCLTAKQQQKSAAPQRELQINPAAHQRAQRSRARSRSLEGRALRRRRFGSEGLFGHLNTYHNGDKAPYRSGPMDTLAQIMVAFVANLETLAAAA
jgi:transposase